MPLLAIVKTTSRIVLFVQSVMMSKKGDVKGWVFAIICILAALYIIGKTTDIVRNPISDNKSTGEITGQVAIATAQDIGGIIGAGYEKYKSNSNPTNMTNNISNMPQI